jgi:hypothetical protein
MGRKVIKGPKLNNISKSFTTRDSLGIEGVATSIQAEICPIVNTVTPRAFYWPFMIWIYYDFYKYSGIPDHTVDAFDSYLKRQDYFFVLATLLTEGSDQDNLVGKQQSQIDLDKNPSGPYPFNPAYFKTRYGGMQYYNAGCLSMYFITDEDLEKNKYLSFPMLRPEGENLAKAFESVIKNTEYYRIYRRNDEPVPRRVLEEYGQVINLKLKDFDKCKSILKHFLFEDDRAIQLKKRSALLTECANYVSLIVKDNNVVDLSLPVCRRLFYDKQLPNGEELKIVDDCKSVANKWEIVVGRMYFVSGVEMLWKFILEQLNEPLFLKEWIANSLKASDFKFDYNQPLSSIIDDCNYDFEARESIISATARRDTSSYSIENGIRIVLSVYKHFKGRDFGEEKAFFDYGIESQSVSMTEMFELVDSYREKPIYDFIIHIIQNWIIQQHYITAFDKMLQGRDGFYYEIIDNRYIKKHEFTMGFQGIRMQQLTQVMRDLDML